MKEPIDGDCLILSEIKFQIVGAAKPKALRPMVVVVKGTCSRLCVDMLLRKRGTSFRKRCNCDVKFVDKLLVFKLLLFCLIKV